MNTVAVAPIDNTRDNIMHTTDKRMDASIPAITMASSVRSEDAIAPKQRPSRRRRSPEVRPQWSLGDMFVGLCVACKSTPLDGVVIEDDDEIYAGKMKAYRPQSLFLWDHEGDLDECDFEYEFEDEILSDYPYKNSPLYIDTNYVKDQTHEQLGSTPKQSNQALKSPKNDLDKSQPAVSEKLSSPSRTIQTALTFETQSTASINSLSFDDSEESNLADNNSSVHIINTNLYAFEKFDMDIADTIIESNTYLSNVDEDAGVEVIYEEHVPYRRRRSGGWEETKEAESDDEECGEDDSNSLTVRPLSPCVAGQHADDVAFTTPTASFRRLSFLDDDDDECDSDSNKENNDSDRPIVSQSIFRPKAVRAKPGWKFADRSVRLSTPIVDEDEDEVDDIEILGGYPFPQLVRMHPQHSLFEDPDESERAEHLQ